MIRKDKPIKATIPGKWLEDSSHNKVQLTEMLHEEMEAAIVGNHVSFYWNGFAYFVQPDYNMRYGNGRNTDDTTNTNLSALGRQAV